MSFKGKGLFFICMKTNSVLDQDVKALRAIFLECSAVGRDDQYMVAPGAKPANTGELCGEPSGLTVATAAWRTVCSNSLARTMRSGSVELMELFYTTQRHAWNDDCSGQETLRAVLRQSSQPTVVFTSEGT